MSTSPDPGTDTYSPKYVSPDDVPLGDDEWPGDTKLTAIKYAEGSLEDDVNGGEGIDNHRATHSFAVAALATHILASGAISTRSTKLGDIADTGSRREDYADQYLEMYEARIASLTGDPTDGSGSGGDGSGSGPGGSGASPGNVSAELL